MKINEMTYKSICIYYILCTTFLVLWLGKGSLLSLVNIVVRYNLK